MTEIQIPIFNQLCVICHGNSGGLSLVSYVSLMTGGNHGIVVIPGDAENSILTQKISPNPPFGDRMPRNNPTYFDDHPEQRQTIVDWINEGANETISIVEDMNNPPQFFTIQNSPNPFNKETRIVITFDQAGWVKLTIVNSLGKIVKTFKTVWVKPGKFEIQWRGEDDLNHQVASGIYILQVHQRGLLLSQKLELIK